RLARRRHPWRATSTPRGTSVRWNGRPGLLGRPADFPGTSRRNPWTSRRNPWTSRRNILALPADSPWASRPISLGPSAPLASDPAPQSLRRRIRPRLASADEGHLQVRPRVLTDRGPAGPLGPPVATWQHCR